LRDGSYAQGERCGQPERSRESGDLLQTRFAESDDAAAISRRDLPAEAGGDGKSRRDFVARSKWRPNRDSISALMPAESANRAAILSLGRRCGEIAARFRGSSRPSRQIAS
jgi:hypothetical protein